MGTTKVSAPEGLPFVDVSREFDAPRALIYRAFTEPELLAQWLGPRRLTTFIDHYDVRDGGSWRYVQRDTDGSEYGFHGVFHGEPTPERMVQTFEFEGAPGHVSLDELTLEEHDGRTTVHTHTAFQSVAARDAMVGAGMEGGMNEGFERLEELLASMSAPVG